MLFFYLLLKLDRQLCFFRRFVDEGDFFFFNICESINLNCAIIKLIK